MRLLSARRPLLALLVVMGLAAAGCSNPVPYAAIVNDHTITVSDVSDELDEIAGNDAYVAAIEAAGVTVRGVSEGTYSTGFVAQVLTRQIAFALVDAELAERGITVSDADVASAGVAVSQQVGGDAVWAAFSEEYRQSLSYRTAQVTVLQEALSDTPTGPDAARAYFNDNIDQFTQACARHILYGADPTSDDPEAARQQALDDANDAIARLADGADFEQIAITESTDTGSGSQGGDLGCAPKGVYVPEFEDAIFNGEVGEVLGPVESQFGFHVITVYERDEPVFEDVEAQVRTQMANQGQQAFSDWISAALQEAEIEVDARYGTWGGGFQPTVLPPDQPQRPVPPPEDLVPFPEP